VVKKIISVAQWNEKSSTEEIESTVRIVDLIREGRSLQWKSLCWNSQQSLCEGQRSRRSRERRGLIETADNKRHPPRMLKLWTGSDRQ